MAPLSATSLHTELMDLQGSFASDTCWCHVHSMLALLGLGHCSSMDGSGLIDARSIG